MPFLEDAPRTSRRLIGTAAVGCFALAGAVWAAQSNTVSARMCQLRVESCEREQAHAEELNARLLAERRVIEAERDRKVAEINRAWESKVAAVQTEWARNELVWREDYDRKLTERIQQATGGAAPTGDASAAVASLRPYFEASEDTRQRLGGALSELDGLRAENDSLVDQLWTVRMERDDAKERLGSLGKAVETERSRRRVVQFEALQARAVWSICADMSKQRREECAVSVRKSLDGAERRFTECLAYSDVAPELVKVEGGHDVPTYWRQVWGDELGGWYLGLCDVKLPEAAGP